MSVTRNLARLLPNSSGRLPASNAVIGSVIQVVHYEAEIGHLSSTSNSYVDTGFGATITPTSINSKILVILDIGMTLTQSSGSLIINVARNGTLISNSQYPSYEEISTAGPWHYNPRTFIRYDSPMTTSPVRYEYCGKTNGSGQFYLSHQGSESRIVLMEIAG